MPDFPGTLKTPRLPSAPGSPTVGQMYYDTTVNVLFFWNGTNWVDSVGVPNGGTVGQVLTKRSATDYATQWSTSMTTGSGTLASRPAASSYTIGSTYYATDTNEVYVTDGVSTWTRVHTGLTYQGDWVAGSYVEGDIVVYNGQCYVAQRPTSQTPAPFGPGGLPAIVYGTTLPASPVDGQIAVLVDNVGNPSYQWQFRYNASSSSAYKWEFVGGSAAFALVPTQESCTGVGTWVDMTTVGPSIVLPRAGDYDITAGSHLYIPVVQGSGSISYAIGATTPLNTDGAQGSTGSTGSGFQDWSSVHQTRRKTGLAAVTVTAKYNCVTGGSGAAQFRQRYLSIVPVRVS